MLFELSEIIYRRDGRTVLDALSARMPVGASCLLGPSGSGKSTVLRLLNRLIDPDAGRVVYEGRDIRELEVLALRREVCLVPQVPALVEGSVGDNVAFGPRLAGHSFDSRTPLELAGLDASFAERSADRLSV
ncbi:MAG: ATP-binding cassette domain-containing protein, partial [Actinomycetota bacterium]|nr:ATP-binding cassette domain-containing protein [Actinomycetota bacterium]